MGCRLQQFRHCFDFVRRLLESTDHFRNYFRCQFFFNRNLHLRSLPFQETGQVGYEHRGRPFHSSENWQRIRWKGRSFKNKNASMYLQVISLSPIVLNITEFMQLFRVRRLAGSEVIRKYYSPPSGQRDKIARQKFNAAHFLVC